MSINMDVFDIHKEDKEMKSQPISTKQIRVSDKRQITIPKRFYERLGMEDSLICELRGNEIILRPAPIEEDFSAEILKEIVNEGYEGEELIAAFQERKSKIRPAVEALMAEADQVAQAFTGTGDEETEALFRDVRE